MHINQKKCTRSTDGILRRTALFILVTYVILALLFYFLADEQLHFRPSRGDFGFPVADSGITELTSDTIVEQRFTNKIQRLEEISVQWGDSYHPNADTVTLGLYDPESGELILGETFDASVIGEAISHRRILPKAIIAASKLRWKVRQFGYPVDENGDCGGRASITGFRN